MFVLFYFQTYPKQFGEILLLFFMNDSSAYSLKTILKMEYFAQFLFNIISIIGQKSK